MGIRWTLITGTGLFTRKSKRNVKLDPKQISYRRRGHPSCWSSYRFYSLMGDIGSKKPTRTSWEFVWIILRFLCLKIKIMELKDYSRLSLCLSFRVSLISIDTDYYFTVACDSYLISSSHFTSIFNGYNFNDYAFIYKDNYQNSDHFLYSMSIFYYIFREPISNYFLFCKTYNEGIFLLYLIL